MSLRMDQYGYPALDQSHAYAQDDTRVDFPTARRGVKVETIMEPATFNEQGSQAWLKERLGFCTASRFKAVMTNPRSKSETFSDAALTYMDELICEHLTEKPANTIKTYAMEHGTRWEPVARDYYRQHLNIEVQEVGFIHHPSERFVGCSPDGLTATGGCEFKCPLTHAPHLRVIEDGIPDEHRAQVQGAMWICNKPTWDFVSYHDDFPAELRLAVVAVARDDQFIEQLAERVIVFRDHMVLRLQQIIERMKGKVAA